MRRRSETQAAALPVRWGAGTEQGSAVSRLSSRTLGIRPSLGGRRKYNGFLLSEINLAARVPAGAGARRPGRDAMRSSVRCTDVVH